MWNVENWFSSFVGTYLKYFTDNIRKVISLLEEHILSIEYLVSLTEVLMGWPALVKFPEITKIAKDYVKDYETEM